MELGHVDHITFNVTDIKAATGYFQKPGLKIEGLAGDGDVRSRLAEFQR